MSARTLSSRGVGCTTLSQEEPKRNTCAEKPVAVLTAPSSAHISLHAVQIHPEIGEHGGSRVPLKSIRGLRRGEQVEEYSEHILARIWLTEDEKVPARFHPLLLAVVALILSGLARCGSTESQGKAIALYGSTSATADPCSRS